MTPPPPLVSEGMDLDLDVTPKAARTMGKLDTQFNIPPTVIDSHTLGKTVQIPQSNERDVDVEMTEGESLCDL